MVKDQNIKYLFEPRSVAVIGASNDKGKIGNAVISNIIKGGYKTRFSRLIPRAEKLKALKHTKAS